MASHGVARVAGAGARSEEQRQKELQQIAAYKGLVDVVHTKVAERQYTLQVLSTITRLLNENPEYYTVWNHRRRVLDALFGVRPTGDPPTKSAEHDIKDLIDGDLDLTFALLRKFPKCYWIWNHRNWILRKGEALSASAAAGTLWSGELQLVGKMLRSDSRNFHAWSYRRFVVAQLQRLQAPAAGVASEKSLAEGEFEYTTKMIKTNLSNFSAWHNRSKLIPRILDERQADSSARREMLGGELALICTAINTDPFDQSIWSYHQFLMNAISPDCSLKNRIALDFSNSDRLAYYAHEIKIIREILDDEEDCKWIYEALLYCARCYLLVDGGTECFTTLELRSWLNQLKKLDPLRKGRWDELGRQLGLE